MFVNTQVKVWRHVVTWSRDNIDKLVLDHDVKGAVNICMVGERGLANFPSVGQHSTIIITLANRDNIVSFVHCNAMFKILSYLITSTKCSWKLHIITSPLDNTVSMKDDLLYNILINLKCEEGVGATWMVYKMCRGIVTSIFSVGLEIMNTGCEQLSWDSLVCHLHGHMCE